MALPKLNEINTYKMTIPSTGQEISYRPYLVKEEKQMMIASESNDQKQMMETMARTIEACVQEDINVKSLATFDVEYMFTQIRSRSVGETAEILISCGSDDCDHKSTVVVNLTEAKVDISESDKIIEITDKVSVEMKYPSYIDVMNNYKEGGDDVEFGFTMVAKSINAVLTEDERIAVKDLPTKEVMDFIESMSRYQFEKIGKFIENIPQLGVDTEWACEKCGYDNKYKLRGLQDFFS